MATFIRPEHALAAGLRMRSAMGKLNEGARQAGSRGQDRHP